MLKSWKVCKHFTKVYVIAFHSRAINQKIMFYLPRKFPEIHSGIFEWKAPRFLKKKEN